MKTEGPRTRAEATDYQETSRHADVLAFLQELAGKTDLVRLGTMGTSGEGQDMAIAIVSDRGAFTPAEARAQKKAIVMCQANIHAGEVEGKESVLALARDLTLTRLGRKILSRICLVIIPDLNPDGNDRISPENRRLDLAHLEGQENPPGGVGTRNSGQGWNLNRDYMKQEAPETRNLAGLFQEWWPHVFIDCHTSDGSITAFDLTYDTSHSNQLVFGKLLGFTRKALDRIGHRVEVDHGYRSYWYGNYAQDDAPESGWHTYPALPRFGSHYRGLQGRLDILLETYSYLSYKRRCEVIYAWLLEIFRFAAKNRKKIIRTVEREEALTIARGTQLDPRPTVGVNYGVAGRDAQGALVFSYPAHALDGDEAMLVAYDRESVKAHRYPGTEIVRYRGPHKRWFIPTVAVSTPAAYIVTAPVGDRLRGHGIATEKLEVETTLEVESYIVLAQEKTFSPDVATNVPPRGTAEVPLSQKPAPRRFETVLSVRPERRTVTFPAGSLVVRTAQRAGTLAVYLLEPQSDDGFARWEFLDAHTKVGEPYPVHRVALTGAIPGRKAE
jgi:hypothetical protein